MHFTASVGVKVPTAHMLNKHPRFKSILERYWRDRVISITLLWLSMLLGVLAFQGAVNFIERGAPCLVVGRGWTQLPSIDSFLDWRLPLALLGGVAVLVISFVVAAGREN